MDAKIVPDAYEGKARVEQTIELHPWFEFVILTHNSVSDLLERVIDTAGPAKDDIFFDDIQVGILQIIETMRLKHRRENPNTLAAMLQGLSNNKS